jgi:hypothetical protein
MSQGARCLSNTPARARNGIKGTKHPQGAEIKKFDRASLAHTLTSFEGSEAAHKHLECLCTVCGLDVPRNACVDDGEGLSGLIDTLPNYLASHIAWDGQHSLTPYSVDVYYNRKLFDDASLGAKSVEKAASHCSWLMVIDPLHNSHMDFGQLARAHH